MRTLQYFQKFFNFFPHNKLKKPPSKVTKKNSNPLFFPYCTELPKRPKLQYSNTVAQTEEFMFQIVAYRPTVYRTGAAAKTKIEQGNEKKSFFATCTHKTWCLIGRHSDMNTAQCLSMLGQQLHMLELLFPMVRSNQNCVHVCSQKKTWRDLSTRLASAFLPLGTMCTNLIWRFILAVSSLRDHPCVT